MSQIAKNKPSIFTVKFAVPTDFDVDAVVEHLASAAADNEATILSLQYSNQSGLAGAL